MSRSGVCVCVCACVEFGWGLVYCFAGQATTTRAFGVCLLAPPVALRGFDTLGSFQISTRDRLVSLSLSLSLLLSFY